ncbi:MAG: ferritin family protein [Desulfatibacillaceae bacterium]|nr:ferritin family protein [Desulfatibacillaceae bacterium]
MGFDFSPDEIFAMAAQIEKNGAAFYRKAAKSVSCDNTREILEELAAMEEGHEEAFSQMRAELPGKSRVSTTFDPEGETAMYLKSLADRRVFSSDKEPSFGQDGTCSDADIKEVLEFALSREQESIAFYSGMREMVGSEADKCKVDEIIREEMAHARMISNQLALLKA